MYILRLLYVEPVHLVLGGVLGAVGGFLMFRGAKAMENRVIIGQDYYEKLKTLQK